MIEMKGKWSGWYDAPTPFGRKQFTLVILEVRGINMQYVTSNILIMHKAFLPTFTTCFFVAKYL